MFSGKNSQFAQHALISGLCIFVILCIFSITACRHKIPQTAVLNLKKIDAMGEILRD